MEILRFLSQSGSKMSPVKHALISLMVGLFYGYFFFTDHLVFFVSVAFLAGTLIDLDHFIVGRLVHGDWRFLKVTFSKFWSSLTDVQSVIDDSIDMPNEYRLFSHSLVLTSLVCLNYYFPGFVFDAAILSVVFHLSCDLYADCFMY